MSGTRFHQLTDGRLIAYRHGSGLGPAIVFLPGYMSDMDGHKATALSAWAAEQKREWLLLDYSGCGQSPGDFAQGTLTRWCEEVVALVEAQVASPVILVGSSMGGWLMLLAAQRLGARVAGLVGIAAAPDFTTWGYDDQQKAVLRAGQPVFESNAYGPEPTPTHPAFWSDGQALCQLEGEISIECPVRLLHGQGDKEVPAEISLRLAAALRSDDVEVTLIKGGDHRLSREQDIALLLRTVAGL